MIKCCNCEKLFETEDDLSDIVEKPNSSTANGTQLTDSFCKGSFQETQKP